MAKTTPDFGSKNAGSPGTSSKIAPMERTLLVCCGTGCIANGSKAVAAALEKAAAAMTKKGALRVTVSLKGGIKETGCNGFCENGPIVRLMPDDISYYHVKPSDAEDIVKHIAGKGEIVDRLLYKNDAGKKVLSQAENPFYAKQHKIALRNIGVIEPGSIKDYTARGGFQALKKALTMKAPAIIDEVEKSGLRGRGGAGFPAGVKWRQCVSYAEAPKYVVCNGDEGDPGAFMDRSILEGDPHSVIEGLVIAARAIGAAEGFMYIRDEYELALKNVAKALESARANGYLGKNIMGSGWDFDISVVRGGGAFVCGESSALMASIEGRVGEPRPKYVRSVQRGLWDKPTVLNNVETLANIPYIILHGASNFRKMGTENSKGTKVFALVGKVKRTGLAEVPMGTTIRQLVFDIGGGIPGGRAFKAVQTGGPSGGCIPAPLLDLPIDFDTLDKHGSMMGSGGIIVMDDRTCMVEVARYYTNFLAGESCGKCTPCREGLRRMLEILTDITAGKGREGDIERLEETAETMTNASLCGLGKTAANPVLTTIKYFRSEYEAHIGKKTCPAGICPKLTVFVILKDKCRACGLCRKSCPVSAISGAKASPHVINQKICVSCGSCRNNCPFGAIETKAAKTAAAKKPAVKKAVKKPAAGAAAKKPAAKKAVKKAVKKPAAGTAAKKPADKAPVKKAAAKATAKKPVKKAADKKPVKKIAPKPPVKKPVRKTTVKSAAKKPVKKDVKKTPVKKSVKETVKKTPKKKMAVKKGRASK